MTVILMQILLCTVEGCSRQSSLLHVFISYCATSMFDHCCSDAQTTIARCEFNFNLAWAGGGGIAATETSTPFLVDNRIQGCIALTEVKMVFSEPLILPI